MKIEIRTNGYNERRYGKPYICKIESETRTWGSWIGSAGDAGLLSIDAAPGDIIVKGQKDLRNNSKRSDDWYGVVQADGSCVEYTTHVDAIMAQREYQAAQALLNPLAGVSDAELLAEVERRGLMAR